MVEHNQSKNGSGKYDNMYKFNGKELDESTGMYYYGARYYDPRISIFVSVDPLAEITMEPYQYVSNNPINIIDPTGMYGESWEGGGYGGPKKEKSKADNVQRAFLNVATKYYNGAKAAITSPVETAANVAGSAIGGLNNFVHKDKMDLGNFVTRQVGDAYNSAVNRVTSSDDPYGEMAVMAGELTIEAFMGAGIGKGIGSLTGRGVSVAAFKNVSKTSINVTEDLIIQALKGSDMMTLQGKVSLPMVQRYVKMLENGTIAPPIKVANGIIVEGNHRYVAGRIFGIEPAQVPGGISSSQASRAVPMTATKVDKIDWGGN